MRDVCHWGARAVITSFSLTSSPLINRGRKEEHFLLQTFVGCVLCFSLSTKGGTENEQSALPSQVVQLNLGSISGDFQNAGTEFLQPVSLLPVLAQPRESLLGVPQLRVRVPELALREHQLLARLRQLLLGPLELRVRLEEIQPERGEEEQDAFNGLRSLNRFNNAEKMAAPQPS